MVFMMRGRGGAGRRSIDVERGKSMVGNEGEKKIRERETAPARDQCGDMGGQQDDKEREDGGGRAGHTLAPANKDSCASAELWYR